MPKLEYNPEKDIPDLSGKVILITGGTAGLGLQTVALLAAHSPSHIIFTGRSASSAATLISTLHTTHPLVPLTFIPLDLTSLSSILTTTQKILSLTPHLNILILNAGTIAPSPSLTKDGYEIHFGTNHLAHALLTHHLLPILLLTAKLPNSDVRVISLSSEGSAMHPIGGIQFNSLKTKQDGFLCLGPWQRYAQSKLANIIYTAELARRYPAFESGILFVSVHPGVFNTGLVKGLGWGQKAFIWISMLGRVQDEKIEGRGAWNTCWAATSERGGVVEGTFYLPVGRVAGRVRENRNQELAGRLWEWTEKELEGWM